MTRTDVQASPETARMGPEARWIQAFLAAAILLSLFVYASRIAELSGPLGEFLTTGGENHPIYDVWKVAHGHPLYQFPDRENYDSTLYNFLFYETYGRMCGALGLDEGDLVAASRMLTFVFAVLGAFAQWRAMRFLLPAACARWELRLAASVAISTWMGTTFVNWWVVTVRPDVPANALAMAGLCAFFRAMGPGGWPSLFLSALAFFAAWGFKQSVVWMLAAAVGTGLFFRHARGRSIALAALVGGGMLVALACGTAEYRSQIVVAPTWNPLVASLGFSRLHGILAPNLFFFLLACVPAVPMLLRRRDNLPPIEPDPGRTVAWRVLVAAALVATATNAVALAKVGSGRNQFMEALVAVATLAGVNLIRLLRSAPSVSRRRLLWAIALFAAVLVGRPLHSVVKAERAAIVGGSPEQLRERRELRDVMRDLPRPVFIEDGILGQPWNANDGRFPTIIVDWVPYFGARCRGVLRGGGVAGYAARREFGSILIRPGDVFFLELVPAARKAGYVSRPLPESLRRKGWRLFVRTKH